MKKFLNYIKVLAIKVVKTMAETALAVIGTGAIGILDVDWVGLLSACALSGIITILFNLKDLKVPQYTESGDM